MHRSDLLTPFRTFSFLWLGGIAFTLTVSVLRADATSVVQSGWWLRAAHALGLVVCLTIPRIRLLLGQFYLPAVLAFAGGGVLLIELAGSVGRIDNPVLLTRSLNRVFIMSAVIAIMMAWHYRLRPAVLFLATAIATNLALIVMFSGSAEMIDLFRGLNIMITLSLVFITYLVSRLSDAEQQKQRALMTANRNMAQYAGNIEELTISRERNRMARELHDTLAHTLSGLSVQLETVRAFWDVDEVTAKGLLDQALSATRSGLGETRRALQSLRATPLEDLGLVLALRGLAESAESRAGLKLDLDLPTQPLNVAPSIEQAVYRIAQEAVNNVVKHATAKTLTLSLKAGEQVELIVADDGVGFSAETQEENGHYGLIGLHERAAIVNGIVTIESQPNQGTTIRLTIDQE